MADMEIRLTKDELLRQVAIQDFWSEIAFQEGYEVAPGYSFDDIEGADGACDRVALEALADHDGDGHVWGMDLAEG